MLQQMSYDEGYPADMPEYTGGERMHPYNRPLIIVRGAGDISTGTIHRLHRAGFPVAALESAHPSAIRRWVAFSEAVYDGTATVEGETAVSVKTESEIAEVLAAGRIPLLIDPAGESIRNLKPAVVVDAILAKKNLGTTMEMAPLTIGLGPGFEAGKDVHYVIETMRGHNLGRIISQGSAMENTGIPGIIAGYGAERVIYADAAGTFHIVRDIGSRVQAGEVIGTIRMAEQKQEENQDQRSEQKQDQHQRQEQVLEVPARTVISGIVRGIIREGYPVTKGFKIADVDPREDQLKNCSTISDKARCIAGSVLELVCRSCGI